jgi:hypothetical protein
MARVVSLRLDEVLERHGDYLATIEANTSRIAGVFGLPLWSEVRLHGTDRSHTFMFKIGDGSYELWIRRECHGWHPDGDGSQVVTLTPSLVPGSAPAAVADQFKKTCEGYDVTELDGVLCRDVAFMHKPKGAALAKYIEVLSGGTVVSIWPEAA